MIEKLPSLMTEEVLSNKAMKRYLGSLNDAKGYTPRSWLWDGVNGNPFSDPASILKSWKRRLSRLKQGSEYEQIIYEFDAKSEDKWGPQGGHPPLTHVIEEVVMNTFKASSSDEPSAFATPEWKQAIEAVIHYFHSLGVKGLRPLTPEHSMKRTLSMYADRLASNSGYPDFSRRKEARVWKKAVLDANSGEYVRYPAILLFRYYRKKLRMVWMFPFSANIAEACYYMPVFDRLTSIPELTSGFFAPWKGFEEVRSLVTKTYLEIKNSAAIAASDFSATDEHFRIATSKQALRVLGALFQKRFYEGLESSIQHMHEIPLLISENEWITGDHGVSSGSMWTNFIETIFDFILSKYAEIKSHGLVRGLYAIGDDCAWVVQTSFFGSFKQWLEDLGKSVGQVINATKTMLEPDRVKTLQRLFQRGYTRQNSQLLRAVYPTIRALNSLIYPERMHNSKDWSYDMFAVRTFAILENCVDHPLFMEFVKFVLKGSPRLKNWVKQSDKQLNSKQTKAKFLPGLNTTYNQEGRDRGLASFESVRVAREL
jgi:hypothetical protein